MAIIIPWLLVHCDYYAVAIITMANIRVATKACFASRPMSETPCVYSIWKILELYLEDSRDLELYER